MKEIQRKSGVDKSACDFCEIIDCSLCGTGSFHPGCPSDPAKQGLDFDWVMLDYLNALIAEACEADRQEG